MIRKAIKYILIILLVFILAGVTLILSSEQRIDDQSLTNDFNKSNINLNLHDSNKIRAWKTKGFKRENAIVFIHGAPGSGDQFNIYLKDSLLRNVADIITLDRPGYGYSNYGNPQTNIQKQAESIFNTIYQIADSTQHIILVSHSFGGPIASYIGIRHPNKIKGHLMLNPVMDPESEPMFWFSGAPLWWPIKYISSGAMKVAAHEKISHPEELESLSHLWTKSKIPTIMIQGRKDWLAPFENAQFVKDHFDPDFIKVKILDESSHFVPFNQTDYVIEQILELIHQAQKQ
mgnify:CR=1 FL=1